MSGLKSNEKEPRLRIERILSAPARTKSRLPKLLAIWGGFGALVAVDVAVLKTIVQTTGEGLLIAALAGISAYWFTRAAEAVRNL